MVIMLKVNPEFRKEIQQEGKKKVLYLIWPKSLYVYIDPPLLWYNLYKDNIEQEGFELNPYDKFRTTKIINGKQCTTQWYVDDN